MARAFRDQGPFDRAYDVAWTTVHTGIIHGGTALNIVPRDCSFDFEIRHLPQDDPQLLFEEIREYAERFLPAMRKVDADTFIEFDALSATPGFDTGGDAAVARLVATLQRRGARLQGLVRLRGGAVPPGEHPDDRVRPRAHRAGAPAERMDRARAARPLRRFRAPAGRRAVRRLTRATRMPSRLQAR